MPTEAEARVHRFADAVTRRDAEAAVAECHEDVEFFSALASLEGRAYVGHDGIRRYFDEVVGAWDEWRVELHRVEETADGRLAVAMTMHVRGRQSGAEVAQGLGHIWDLEDGKLRRCKAFATGEAALEAAGLD